MGRRSLEKLVLLSIVMLFLYIFFLLLIGISFITLLYSPAFLFYGDYIQPIEAGMEIFSVLFLSNMLPIAPSKRLTKMEKEAPRNAGSCFSTIVVARPRSSGCVGLQSCPP